MIGRTLMHLWRPRKGHPAVPFLSEKDIQGKPWRATRAGSSAQNARLGSCAALSGAEPTKGFACPHFHRRKSGSSFSHWPESRPLRANSPDKVCLVYRSGHGDPSPEPKVFALLAARSNRRGLFGAFLQDQAVER